MKTTIADIQKKYYQKLDHIDLELLIAHVFKKSREFVLAHPEYVLPKLKIVNCELKIARRMRGEPLAYILGFKEFFGYPFLVSPATLIPRPETELMVEETLEEIKSQKSKVINIIDVGTGSGNIIISVAKNLEPTWTFDVQMQKGHRMPLYGIDISKETLRVAKRNAKKNNVAEKIKFIQGNLLTPIIENCESKIENSKMIILANLPYLSKKIYAATAPTVKKFEPKSALYSSKEGLAHYEKLFKQIKILEAKNYGLKAILEISPEQKTSLAKMAKKYFPASKIVFKKDLAGRTRLAIISLQSL